MSGRVATGLVCVLLGIGVITLFQTQRDALSGWWDLVAPPPPRACTEDDPTTTGCLTPTAPRLHHAMTARFGRPGVGAPVRSVSCWSEHGWNPSSDHPAGRACDVFPGGYGVVARGDDLIHGWTVAQWLRDNATTPRVRYVIWQGRIWYRGGFDDGGWGHPYTGGGVYDPSDVTGGHFDHIHVSVLP